ncbi:MAG TPA: Rrf2 family transcriptional regulator [Acidimicrobiales bacterium]|nr:Rrf2 family transcriptional regulator [Acidimicrobiales bacterium]
MRIGEGVEWAIHCCTLLAVVGEERPLPVARLAEFHGVPAPYLAKQMQALARAGIVESVAGKRGGYRLRKAPPEVSLLDIYDAVEGDAAAFRCTEIRQRGPAALEPDRYRKPCGIARAMWAAEEAFRAQLRSTTLADLLVGLVHDVPPESAAKGAAWMQEVLG